MRFYSVFASLILLTWACENNDNTNSSQNILSQEDSLAFIETGMQITSATFQTLSGALKRAMDEGGIQNAIQYCNVHAFPIVDSLSNRLGAQIRRTSDRVRNKTNTPTPLEMAMIETYKLAGEGNEASGPVINHKKGTTAYYAPIFTAPMCLKCHGKIGTDISEADAVFLSEKYPDDKALGYKTGELRGIWSITFDK